MLISGTLGLPLLPVRGLLALARTIQQQAEQELTSPAALRRRLEAVEREYGDGDESDPLAARRKADEMEQALGAIVKPATVVPLSGTDSADDDGADAAGDR